MEEKKKEGFGSKIGFIFAAAGSAVGLANIWRFPYLAAKDGGGLFGGVFAEKAPVGEQFQVVELERRVADGFPQVVEPQLTLNLGVLEFHVAVFAGGDKMEGLFFGKSHEEGIQGLRVVAPLDVHAGAGHGLVHETPLDIYHQVLFQKKMGAQVLGESCADGKRYDENNF